MRIRTSVPLLILAALVLVACDETPAPTSTPRAARVDATANVISQNFPITWPTGIANDANSLFISTEEPFRTTYLIDPTIPAITGTLPGAFNPRDVVWGWPEWLFLSDVDNFVSVRSTFSGIRDSLPIPWRGGGIARWRDSLYVGNLDADSLLVLYFAPFWSGPVPHPVIRKFAIPVRPEGLVADTSVIFGGTATLWAITPFDSWMTEFDLQGNFIRRCNTPYNPGPFGLGGITLLRDTFYIAHPQGGDPTLGTTIIRIARSDLVCVSTLAGDTIDIDPGHLPNRVNPRGNATIKVAAITTPSRDARTLIPSSVRFGHLGVEAPEIGFTIRDVDGDGDLAVVFEFKVRATGILCGDTAARLTATASVGPPFSGADAIQTLGCGP